MVRDVLWATGKSPGRSIHFPILALLSLLHPQPVVEVGWSVWKIQERISSVQFSRSVMSDSLPCHELQHARFLCPSLIPGAYSNSCTSSQWCYPAISSSVIPFSCPQSFPASGSFQMSQFFPSGGQNIGVSASASVLQMNIQDWFPLGLTGLISLQSKELPRVFSNTTVQKY